MAIPLGFGGRDSQDGKHVLGLPYQLFHSSIISNLSVNLVAHQQCHKVNSIRLAPDGGWWKG